MDCVLAVERPSNKQQRLPTEQQHYINDVKAFVDLALDCRPALCRYLCFLCTVTGSLILPLVLRLQLQKYTVELQGQLQ